MRTSSRIIIVALLVLAAVGWGWRTVPAQTTSRYFVETGHYVMGDFLAFYRSIPEPELIYGYPITEALRDTVTGLQVQYFQKARFELHPAEPAANRVQLTPVGNTLYSPGQSELGLTSTTACQSFPSIRFQVCYSFLDFFNEHGGVAQFGYPISNMELHNGLTVQYFERARFEWHPGLNRRSTILLSNLGRQYFDNQGEAPSQLLPEEPPGPGNDVIGGLEPPVNTLKARAFPATAVTRLNSKQTIYVLVQDQRSLPVAKATVTVKLYLPNGQTQNIIALDETTEEGIAQIPFSFRSTEVGMARVEITVTLDDKQTQANTSFRIWW